MKIVWVSYTFGEYTVQHLNTMADRHRVLLVMPRSVIQTQPRCLDPRVETYLFDSPRLRQPVRQAFSLRAIYRAIRAFGPQILHLQQGHMYFNFVLPWLRDIPLVVTIHDPRYHAGDWESRKTPQWIMDFGFRWAARVIVHGQPLAEIVAREIGIPAERIHVIPHVAIGDSLVNTVPDPFAAEEPETILFFGRIWEYKGLEYLIRAQPLISEHCPNLKIIVAGEGEDLDRYRRMIHDPTAFEIINRWIDDEERTRLFLRSAVVVLPYIEATQSGVVPVAYSCARPVVATRVGALSECVEHDRTGLLVEPRDVEGLAQALIALLRDPARRREMGMAGQRKLALEASPDAVVRQTVEVYEQALLDRHAAGRSPNLERGEAPDRLDTSARERLQISSRTSPDPVSPPQSPIPAATSMQPTRSSRTSLTS